MTWARDRPKVFEKVWLTRRDPYLRVQIPIYYQCAAHNDVEHFYAELDGKTVRGNTPGEVRKHLPELVEVAYSYSGWAFFLKVSEQGRDGCEYHDKGGHYSGGQSLDLDHVLLLIGKRSDGKFVQSPCHLSSEGVPHIGPAIQHPEKKPGPCCKGPGTDLSLIDVKRITEWHGRDEDRSWSEGKKKRPEGYMGAGVVPFTTERLRWLLRLEEAVEALRERIDEIVEGGGQKLERRLDAAVAAHQMPLALPPGPLKKHRRRPKPKEDDDASLDDDEGDVDRAVEDDNLAHGR
jgi:hypothetical protein